MNKRFFLALILTAIVIVATPLVFQNSRPRPVSPVPVDSTRKTVAEDTRDTARPPVPSSAPKPISDIAQLNAPLAIADTVVVKTPYAAYTFNTKGAAPISVVLDSYPSLRPDIRGGRAQLVGHNDALARYRLVVGRDTIALDSVVFRAEQGSSLGAQTIEFTGSAAGHALRLTYAFALESKEQYLVGVSASVADAPPGSGLLIQLPRTLHSNEADTLDDLNHLAVSYRPSVGDVKSVSYSKLDSTELRAEPGPINWVATRDKYFLSVFRATKTPFSVLSLHGAPRKGKLAPDIHANIALPLSADGTAGFEIYAGPQNFERLQRLGGDLDQVNPYAGWLHGVVQPFATIVMKALLWMKRTTQLNYGWVLVLFGVIIRLVLWPLNQGAMRTSMKMQRLQPELQALQKKHTDDPKKQQEAIMKVYKDHGMSPLSPLMGCLPMLLPMPVLFALYYVFQNTIEFRGVPFLWLPDISLRDPFYITPLLMGVSMFVMSWIGMRNSPPNPQAKMMSYMMPVMLTVLFLNFASGLNLYYAVQNLAAIPQQWLLARERGKSAPVVPTGTLAGKRT
ncbi:MAG: membrane protein insertase YidC [bacterium]